MDPVGTDMLYNAVEEAVAAMKHLETEWDENRLSKKLREYFNKGAKNLSYAAGLEAAVNEYADAALSSIFAGLGEREWLFSGQVDFLLLLDAGIKDNFPGHLLRNVAQQDFEGTVLSAYERAFDEQRFGPILSEAVPNAVSGPKIKKKVWNAFDQGRRDTVLAGLGTPEEFIQVWVSTTVAYLSEASQGCPEGTLEASTMTQLFSMLLEAGGLPTALMQEGTPLPSGIDGMVNAAYVEHTVVDEWAGQPTSKKQKAAGAYGGGDPWAMKGMMKGGWGDGGKVAFFGKGKDPWGGWGKGW